MNKFEEKTISTRTVYNGKIFDISYDEVELSDGLIRHREIIKHPGGVVICATKGNKLLMVKQYRYATKSTQIELPAGRLEYGEDPLNAPKRELKEETGYIAQNWKNLGYIFTTFGICDEKLYLFKAEDLIFEQQQLDEGEILDFFEIDLDEVHKLIKNGTINDAKTICALSRAFLLDNF